MADSVSFVGAFRSVLAGVLLLWFGALDAKAQQYWDGAQTTSNNVVNGGTGTWNAISTNWTTAAGSPNSTWASGSAIFAGTAGTVTVGEPVIFTSLQFTTSNYVVNGPATLRAAAPTVSINPSSGAIATIGASIVDDSTPAALIKLGSGTLILTGTNTSSGGTIVSAGLLQIGNGGAAGSIAGPISVTNGVLTFFRSDSGLSIGNAFSGSGSGTIRFRGTGIANQSSYTANAGTNTFTGTGGVVVESGARLQLLGAGIAAGAAITVQSGGSLHLTASSSYSGPLSIAGSGWTETAGQLGALRLSNNAIVNGNVLLTGNARIGTSLAGDTGRIAGIIDDGANVFGLEKHGSGTLVLTANNTYDGGTTIAAGTLQIGNGGLTGSIAGAVANSGGLVFNRADAITYAGVVSGTGTLEKRGADVLSLTGANTFSGATTVAEGTLQIGAGGSTGTLGSSPVTVSAGADLTLNRSDNLTFANAIAGGGTLTKRGAGVATLGGTNSYSGNTTVSEGILQAGVVDAIATSAGLTVAPGAQFDLNNLNQRVANLSGAGSVTLGTATLTLTEANGGATTTFSGVVSGAGSLAKTGASRQVLTGANTYTGGTVISAGTLQIGDGGATGALGAGEILNNGTLVFNRDTTLVANVIAGTGALQQVGPGTLALTGTSTYIGGTTIGAGSVLSLGLDTTTGSIAGNVVTDGTLAFRRSDAYTFDGIISGTGGVTKGAAGTTTLTGANTYSGTTIVEAGALQVGGGGTSGSLGTGAVSNSGTLIFNRSNALVVANAISGAGTIVQAGPGTTQLTGAAAANTTQVNAGSLLVMANLASAVTVAPGATLGGIGFIAGAVVVNGGTIAPGQSPGTLTMSELTLNAGSTLAFELGAPNVVAGPLNDLLVVNGNVTVNGTTAVNVANTGAFATMPGVYRLIEYTGTLSGGANLVVGATPMPSTGTVTLQTSVANQVNLITTFGPALQFWDGPNLTANNAIDGGTGVWHAAQTNWTDQNGGANQGWLSGVAIFQGTAGTVTLASDVRAEVLQFSVDGYRIEGGGNTLTMLQQTGPPVAPPVIRVDAGVTATIAAAITGTAGVTKSDPGTLILTADNAYGGGTTIAGGALQIGSGGTAGSVPGNIVNHGQLVFFRSDTANVNPGGLDVANSMSGAGVVTFRGTGLTGESAYTLSGDNSAFSGAFDVLAGARLSAAGPARLGGATVVVRDGGTMFLTAGPPVSNTFMVAGNGWTESAGQLGALRFDDGATITGSVILTGQTRIGTMVDGHTGEIAGVVGEAGGSFGIQKVGLGRLRLAGVNTYTGATTVTQGTLQAGVVDAIATSAGLTVGLGAQFDLNDFNQHITSLSGDGTVSLGAATLTLTGTNPSTTATFSGAIGGTGTLVKEGAHTAILAGNNTYSGGTIVRAGSLQVTGALLGGTLTIEAGATLGGSGLIASAVVIGNGAHVAPGSSPGTMTVGSLALSAGSALDFELGTPNVIGAGVNDLIQVAGNLTLDGTLNVTDAGGFASGVYRLINYGGTLADNGLDVGAVPATFSAGDFLIQTNQANQVNLVVQAGGFTTQFWDPSSTAGNGVIDGGGGIWNTTSPGWTGADGRLNLPWLSGFAVFQGTAGTVLLGESMPFSGMQFSTPGYTIAAGAGQTLQAAGTTTLRIDSGVTATIDAAIVDGAGGAAAVVKREPGTLVLTGANTYTGGTTIAAGTLQIGSGGTAGSLLGDVVNDGTLVFNRADAVMFAGAVTGSGVLVQQGPGTLTLTGNSSHTGGTAVAGGALNVNGALAGHVVVGPGGTLGGTGAILGNVAVGSGAVLSPGASAGTLTVGALNLAAGSIMNYELATPDVVGAGVNDLVNVLGDLTLAGTLNVTPLPGFGGGTYRLINYAGALTDNGLSFGTLPAGFAYALLPAPGQVNLSVQNPTVEPVQFWDGSNLVGNGSVNGGSGVWSGGRTSWTSATGAANQAFGGWIAVFGSTPGAVTVQGDAEFRGLRFLTEGYSLVPGVAGALKTAAPDTVVQVDSGVLAAIDVPIGGPGGINLLGDGTLLLTSDNTYTGGTTIGDAAVLQLGACGTRGSILGDVRDDSLLVFSRSDDTMFAGSISGRGGVIKSCSNTLVVTGANTYTGGTRIDAGTLLGDARSLQGAIMNNAALVFDQATDRPFEGTVFGSGSLTKIGAGSVLLTGNHQLLGPATVLQGTLGLDGTFAGSVIVGRGGTFDANGAIGGSLTVEGRVSVRTPVAGGFGTLSAVGPITLGRGSQLGLDVDAVGGNSFLATNSRAVMDGTLVTVNAEAGEYGRVTSYAVLHANLGLSGAATSRAAVTNVPALDAYLSQSATTLFLTLLNWNLPLQPAAATASGHGIAGAIDRVKVGASGDLAVVARELTALSAPQLALALDAVSGEIHASARVLGVVDSDAVVTIVQSEIAARALSETHAELDPRRARLPLWGTKARRGWIRVRSEFSQFGEDGQAAGAGGLLAAHGADATLGGLTLGADWTFRSHWLAGVGGSYTDGRMTLDGVSERTDFRAPRGLGYIGYARSRWGVDAGLSVAYLMYDMKRAFRFDAVGPNGASIFEPVNREATSSVSGPATELWIEPRFAMTVGSWALQPTVGLRSSWYRLGEWEETGADTLSLSGSAQTLTSVQAEGGMRLTRAVGRVRPFGAGRYRRELTSGLTTTAIQIGDRPEGAYEVDGLLLPRDEIAGEGGVMFLTSRVGFSLSYAFHRSQRQTRQTLQIGVGF